MIEVNIGTDFKIDSFDKCATAEGVYLALKTGKFDGKLSQALGILHKEQKFLIITNIDDFKKILFGKTKLEPKEKETYKNLIKSVFTGPNKIFNGDFVKLLQEVIEKYFFIEINDSSKIIEEMRKKVSYILPELEIKNTQNINPLSYGISDLEFFSYIGLDEKKQEELRKKYKKDLEIRLKQ